MKEQSQFRKSTFSSERDLFSRCVEVAIEDNRVLVRHSRQNATVIEFTRDEWSAFILGVKHNEFDLPE